MAISFILITFAPDLTIKPERTMKDNELLNALGLKLGAIDTHNLYEQVKEIEVMQLYEWLKAVGEFVDGGYEYHYGENAAPYITCTRWEDAEDVKVFAVRMTAPTILNVECAPISDPDFRTTITAEDIEYGQIEFLSI